MKKVIITTVALISALSLLAQDNGIINPQENKTLFKNPTHIGWYAALDFEYTTLDDKDAYLMGLSGGVIFNHSFSLGLQGYGIVNSSDLKYNDISPLGNLYLYGGYGGLKMEYILFPTKVVHLSFPLLIGGGSLFYLESNQMNDYDQEAYAADGFFVLEPGIMVGINLIKFMRFDVGSTYRYTTDLDLPKTNSTIFNGFNGVVSLKFGNF